MDTSTWQTIGTTLDGEYPYVTHIQREQSDAKPRGSRLAGKHIPGADGGYTDGPAKSRRGGRHWSKLNNSGAKKGEQTQKQTASGVSLRRQNAVRLNPWQRIKRFFRRWTWRRRAKHYRYKRHHLRRQSSFVVTPDHSTLNFRFRMRDVVAKQPRPDSWRSVKPVQAWKATNPMALLSAVADEATPRPPLPPTPLIPDTPRPDGSTTAATGVDRSSVVAPPIIGAGPMSRNRGEPAPLATISSNESGDGQSQANHSSQDAENPSQPQNWPKVSLPIKQSSKGSHASTEASPGQSKSRSHSRSRSRTDDDRPSTPVTTDTTLSRIAPTPRAAVPTLTSVVDLRPDRPTRPSLENNSRRQEDSSVPVLVQATSESPTTARARFRPVSWRQSAILLREPREQAPSQPQRSRSTRQRREPRVATEDVDVQEAMDFVSAWSAYLRRAVALRAVMHRQRKSWELAQESRWSQLDYSDSETGSSSGYWSSNSDSYDSHSESDLSTPSSPSLSIAPSETPSLSRSEDDDDDNLQEGERERYGMGNTRDVSDNTAQSIDTVHKRYSSLFEKQREPEQEERGPVESTWLPTTDMVDEPILPVAKEHILPVAALRIAKSPAKSHKSMHASEDFDFVFGGKAVPAEPSSETTVAPLATNDPTTSYATRPEPSVPETALSRTLSASPAQSQTSIPAGSVSMLSEYHTATSESKVSLRPRGSTNSLNQSNHETDKTAEDSVQLLHDYYTEQSRQRSVRRSNVDDLNDQDTVLVRQGTLRSNWAAAADDADSESG